MPIELTELQNAFRDEEIVSGTDLFKFLKTKYPDLTLPTLRWRLFELRRKGKITKVAKGRYSLHPLQPFKPPISSIIKRLHNEINRALPYTEHCIWSTAWLESMIVHQPSSKIILVEIEKAAVSKAFAILSEHGRASFLKPTKKEMQFYVLPTQESVIVKPMVLRSPIINIENVAIPRLEKILVDIFSDRELFTAFQGDTLVDIFRNSLTQFQIDLTTIGSYARRRGKQDEIRGFLSSISALPHFIETALRAPE